MNVDKQAKREAKQLFKSCFSGGVINEVQARAIVSRIMEVKPRGYLAILTHFHRLLKLEVERRTARIESASALTPEMQSNVREALAKAYGPGLNISFKENKSLIGGMRVQVGSDVYDGTVRARLEALEASF